MRLLINAACNSNLTFSGRMALLALLLTVLPITASADAKNLLAERLDLLTSMRADFEQITATESGDIINTSLGKLALTAGGRFNIETLAPFPQLLVSDGIDLYTYDEELSQVIVQPLSQDIRQVPILLFGNANVNFLKDYNVTLVGDDERPEFSLQPLLADTVFQTLTLRFMGDTPSGITLMDSLGQLTDIQLSDVQVNQSIPSSTFQYEIPEGVDLIDDR